MLLTITTTREPATDLGYLLHKHPARVQEFPLWFGAVRVFYPKAQEDECTAAILLDVDPQRLRRRGRGEPAFRLEPYVNDRSYAASSFLSVAISRVLGSALQGTCNARPELVDVEMPLTVRLSAVPCASGHAFLSALFEPLGYELLADGHALDPQFPQWGDSRYYTVELTKTARLRDLLAHLYVLVPVLDDAKHYWVGDDEIDKLRKYAGDWLAEHPLRDDIVRRYMRHSPRLTRAALASLVEDEAPDPDADAARQDDAEATTEETLRLYEHRHRAALAALEESGARRVVDLGCGEGKFLHHLHADRRYTEVVGVDVSHRSLARASGRLHLDRQSDREKGRVSLVQGSALYRDARLTGYDAVVLMEVIEHIDPGRLSALEDAVFASARPSTVVVTTPNREYNARWPELPAGDARHADHRFEWTREEFAGWADRVASEHGYAVEFRPIGEVDPDVGPPTQMGVFRR
ncbi:3' terminal RNA ribose 2'-O-methyltransferase Hen1 [Candidatus Poribacteria bacterium]|nr:3' terminal RNA ribose 2'-O-methyltransferase Hen1 [Candidatus Poribacteria bacterium]MBT5711206.1 3' terminal RNA ribose 2'-O-methyltransferase Hen1 [Candidatus Poribacteria bacterium]MBT7098975.1 3' terminal RNA ribose 2'-O-methyltransferase Hen1 [Candidatus Poribacteria bacterium]MBT7805217.1 3' terminal RNA ribose 2'-O-methyltransferase Hen1 [Candidatus Poribacteria bacterium]